MYNLLVIFQYGLILNLIGCFIFLIGINLKLRSLDDNELVNVIRFMFQRRLYIITSTKFVAQILRFVSLLFPGQILILSLVFSYNLIKYRGEHGVYCAYQQTEKMAMIPIVAYKYNK